MKHFGAFPVAAILAASACLTIGCAQRSADPSDSGDILGDSLVELHGGRERLVCVWSGVPSGLKMIRIALGGGEGIMDIPVSGPSGTRNIPSVGEGTYDASISFIDGDGMLREAWEDVPVTVYGEKYEATLPETVRNAQVKFTGPFVRLSFDSPSVLPEGYLCDEIGMTVNGTPATSVTSASDTLLCDLNGGISIRPVFCPDKVSGDLFRGGGKQYANDSYITPESLNKTIDGYRGIWFDLGQASDYGSKYSGGLGTYTMKHIPMSIYAPEVDRTYFVYGGTPDENRKYLLCMIGCYDHRTHRLQKPRVIMDKGILGVADPHDNPTLQIDRDGRIWVFVSGRGNTRPGVRYRSVNPYDITSFEYVNESVMAYPQVMYHKDKGFFLFFTRYDGTRQLFWQTSEDGVEWSDYRQLASIKEEGDKNSGHYQISNICGTKLCTAFNRHINGNVDTRTNVYFVQSTDLGHTWTTADGSPVEVPVTQWDSNCLVRDYQNTDQTHNCYIKDLNFDPSGNPVILYVTSHNHKTGPEGGTRMWHTLHWTGTQWEESIITTSTHCYDSGSLWIEGQDWVVIAPTDAGPTYWGAGGEVVKWRSSDQGETWVREKNLTYGSALNNTYMRRPWNCADGFYSFWADGDPDRFTRSSLYFCDKSGKVWRMPYSFTSEWTDPE
ncbi:MAG: BNR-4 repeat-containing protein [Candidatus Cryptobacteroides sp.]